MRKTWLLAGILGLACLSGLSHADTVYLLNGGVIEGRVTRKDGKVYIEKPDGIVIIPEDQIDYIEPKRTILDDYEDRLKEIAKKADGQGESYAQLGQWCAENKLKNQTQFSLKKALELDPDNATARTALGYAKYDGRWMTLDEINQVRGLVKHKESWVTPEAKSDLEKLEAATKYENAKAENERLRLQRAEAELQAANAKADAALAETEALREQYKYRDGYGGYGGVVYVRPGGGHKPPVEKPVVLGPGDRATITDANPINGTKYTKPDGTSAKVLTIYREGAPPVTRPLYGEAPQIIDPNAPPAPKK
ncbi:MAG: hypothetical protein KIS92_14755 [Planctomycetota bacterium]|nr:hypothetical protein [Planctomycetota bacterium]